MCVTQAGANGQHAPMLDIGHERHLTQPLDDRIIVHEHDRVPAEVGRQHVVEDARQIEIRRVPIARKILRSLLDPSLRGDPARAGNAEIRRKITLLLA